MLFALLCQINMARTFSPHSPLIRVGAGYRGAKIHRAVLQGTIRNVGGLNDGDCISSVSLSNHNSLDWINYGMSWIYLTHFSSLYVQLPGLFGATGLSPIRDRIPDIVDVDELWTPFTNEFLLQHPELILEVSCALGILVAMFQIVFPKVRQHATGVLAFGLLWFLWHDLVVFGDRFTLYQMDKLVLDAAPITLLAASRIPSLGPAATFGFRWLLSRLYLGAGACKLLSCDLSWRHLSAIHTHFQSQPLPNFLGLAAYKTLPDIVTHPLTLVVLIAELVAPFLFLAPNSQIRKVAFVVNALLMAGIATFGDFGVLQVLLGIIGLALLDDLPPTPGNVSGEQSNVRVDTKQEMVSIKNDKDSIVTRSPVPTDPFDALSVAALILAAAGMAWVLADLGECRDTLSAAPLGISLVALGSMATLQPLLDKNNTALLGLAPLIASLASLALLAGSIVALFNSVDMYIPYDWSQMLQFFNLGAEPYGLFAVMTGVAGRPVAALEGAYSLDGPWTHIPFLYQINEPSSPLPLCFPHFPRLDWTLWFVPLGETGKWIQQLLRGIVAGDPTIVNGLLDGPSFHCAFPDGPPQFVRVVPRLYEIHPESSSGWWLVSEDPASPMMRRVFSRDSLLRGSSDVGAPPWPSVPFLRNLAGLARPEYFVWACLGIAETARRAVSTQDASSKRL
jgi:hypothetical protein